MQEGPSALKSDQTPKTRLAPKIKLFPVNLSSREHAVGLVWFTSPQRAQERWNFFMGMTELKKGIKRNQSAICEITWV